MGGEDMVPPAATTPCHPTVPAADVPPLSPSCAPRNGDTKGGGGSDGWRCHFPPVPKAPHIPARPQTPTAPPFPPPSTTQTPTTRRPPHSPPSPHLLQGAAPPGAPAQPAARAPIRAARPVVTAHVPPPTPQRRALLQPGQAAPPLQARPPLGVAGVALGAAVDVVRAAHGLGGDRGVSALTLQRWGCPCAFRGRGDD